MPKPPVLLVCGSRNWTDKEFIRRVVLSFGDRLPTLLIHGDNGYDVSGHALWRQPDELAVRGADKLAGQIADELGIPKRVVTPAWHRLGESAGPLRNNEMLTLKPTHVAAFHDNIIHSTGTKDMVLKAALSGAWVRVYSHGKADA